MTHSGPKFVADCMLGRLAKWLRILGFDTAYFPAIEDRELLAFSRREGRILLTRDTGLVGKTRPVRNRLFVPSDDWRDQLAQVLDEFDLWDAARPYTRCLACNRPLKSLPKARARNLVAPYVLEHAESFSLCPECGRVYWKGTHAGDMERKLEALFETRRRARGKSASRG